MITRLVSAAAFLLMAGQSAGAPAAAAQAEQPTPVEGVTVTTPRRGPTPEELSDLRIEQELFRLWKEQPQRVVCAVPPKTGTRLPQPVCGSVERWFNARTPEAIAAGRAPWQLVAEIKKNKRKVGQGRSG